MTLLTFILLFMVFGGLGLIHLFNGEGKGSELFRALLSRLIEKMLPQKPENPPPSDEKKAATSSN